MAQLPRRKSLPAIAGVSAIATLCALATTVAGGCNQQAPPGSESDCPPGSELPEGAAYYPLAEGARWTYVHAKLGDAPWSEEIVMHADECRYRTETVGDPNGSERLRWLDRVGSVIHRVRKLDVIPGGTQIEVTYDPGFPRFDEALLDLAPGEWIVHEYERTERISGSEETSSRTQKYTLEATGLEITVPAGTFTDCVRVRRTREPDVESTLFWFAPGVGKLREEELSTGHTEELSDYEIDGGAGS